MNNNLLKNNYLYISNPANKIENLYHQFFFIRTKHLKNNQLSKFEIAFSHLDEPEVLPEKLILNGQELNRDNLDSYFIQSFTQVVW